MINKAIVNRIVDHDIFLMHIRDYDKKERTERNFWNIEPRDFRATNPDNIPLNPGDIVEFYVPEGKTIIASFAVLILPIIVFIVTFLLLTISGINNEKIKALISLIFMTISFFTYKVLKKFGYKEVLPIVKKKIKRSSMTEFKKKCRDCGSCTACD